LPKLAHNHITIQGLIGLLCLSGLFFLSACGPRHQREADELNSISYAYHYRNLDSTKCYARRALAFCEDYPSGKSEAYNNLAFVSIMHMDYQQAYALLDTALRASNNQVERLVSEVQLMRLCQREARNKEFYDHYERARNTLRRIDEERSSLDSRLSRRMIYAESELHIVASAYYYYVGLEQESIDALKAIREDDIEEDTAQHLNYLYQIGAGGIITQGSAEYINMQEWDYLMRCYQRSLPGDYIYWQANALQGLSEHLFTAPMNRFLLDNKRPSVAMINLDGMPDSLLAGNLAQRSLELFRAYGDVYQTAGAYRTLASCYWNIEDYPSALICLEKALDEDPRISQAPQLVSSIHERLSLTYSALDDKPRSDEHRNSYLDIHEQTRQDRLLESRAEQLATSVKGLNRMIAAVLGMIAVTIVLLLWFYRLRRKNERRDSERLLSDAEQEGAEVMSRLAERQEEITEQLALTEGRIRDNKRRNLENRAKIFLVNSMMPFIDRMALEIDKLRRLNEPAAVKADRRSYVREIADTINDCNATLTEWIQLRRGDLQLHIESFSVNELFDMVKRSRMSFRLKGITLRVEPTEAVVKADKTLTLFMINTLADNARKFTDKGGNVDISATESNGYVEISVADTGCGMTDEQLSTLFTHHIKDGHGFGLLNCRGIIEHYKKLSKLFAGCTLSAESTLGKGSRLSFRLPAGIRRMVAFLLIHAAAVGAMAASASPLDQAARFADSAYYSNIAGTYRATMLFADSARYYLQLCEQPDTSILMGIANETAVAALALHEWDVYQRNNSEYTQLYKEVTADHTLGHYVSRMQRARQSRNVAIGLLVTLLVVIVAAYYLLYYRPQLQRRHRAELRAMQRSRDAVEQKQRDTELMEDELRRAEYEQQQLYISNNVIDNCLSSLKHETMYFPSRIRLLLPDDDNNEALNDVAELTSYYKDLYSLLARQASEQIEATLFDEDAEAYLIELLTKAAGSDTLQPQQTISGPYRVSRIDMPHTPYRDFFTPSPQNIPFLICRQIVRENSEATNRRGCGIVAEPLGEGTRFTITTANTWTHSK